MSGINIVNKFVQIILFASLTILALTGCQHSPRKHYFLLSAAGSSSVSQNQTDAPITQTIGLGPIELAEYLENARIVYNDNVTQMQFADQDYWGESLEKGITRVLAVNLMNLNKTRLVEQFPLRRHTAPEFSLRLTIYDLQIINGEANINASWKLIDNHTQTIITQQRFTRNKTSGTSAVQIAEVYSELLGELAGEMDRALAWR